MKIKKTPFETSIEITTQELDELAYKVPVSMRVGLLFWVKKNFGLDMLPKK